MDLASLDLQEIVKALPSVATSVAALFGIYKKVSNLGLIRKNQRKQLHERIEELTSPKEGLAKTHPIIVQLKFQAIFGGARADIPHGDEILALLEDRTSSEYSNMMDYAACAKYVAYSPSGRTFIPRGEWTDAKLYKQGLQDFFYYLLTATPAIGLLCIPPFTVKSLLIRIPLGGLFGLLAMANAVQAKKIGQAEKLLQRTRALATSEPPPPENAANGTDHPAHPSRTVPEKASGTVPERGVSSKKLDPSKH